MSHVFYSSSAMDLQSYLKQSTQLQLAEALGVSQGLISQWVLGKTKITPQKAIEIERATGKKVTRQELLPEIFNQ
jgi:DNA-binding transcriptional regulator YdaS (Cro superfamily)